MIIWPFRKRKIEVRKEVDATPRQMIPEKGPGRFTSEEEAEIILMIAEMKTPKEIKAYAKETFGKVLSTELIRSYRTSEKWKPLVQRYRDEYEKAIIDVPLASKRKRLDEYGELYEIARSKENLERAQAILRDVREEVEGKRNEQGNNYYFTQINNEFQSLSDEELSEIKLKEVARLEQLREMKRFSAEPIEVEAKETE